MLIVANVFCFATERTPSTNTPNKNMQISQINFDVTDVNMNIVFRYTQKLCAGSELLILRSNGKFEVYTDGVELYSGTYDVESANKIVILNVEGKRFRCNYYLKSDGVNISKLTFQGVTYTPCNR